jgi:hypothetical protein
VAGIVTSKPSSPTSSGASEEKSKMGRGILLWLLGVPLWLVIIIVLFIHR